MEEPPSNSGFHYRAERRSARRAIRRRKRVTRLSLVAGPVVVVILVVVALLVFLGGPEGTSGAETTTTAVTTAPIAISGGSLLLVEQGEAVPAVVLLPADQGGPALAIPGNTILETADGFKTPTELHASDQEQDLRLALSRDLDVDIGAVAWLPWSELRGVLAQMGQAGSLPAELQTTAEDAGRVAEAVVAVIGESEMGAGSAVWDRMEIAGDADGFRANAKLLSASTAAAGLTAAALPGKVVEGVFEGVRFEYFEPDMKQAQALLGGEGPGATVTLEVQNGSGVVGIAQQVGGMLEPLGYDLLPFRNAEGFPDVATTRIIAAPDAAAEAEQVRSALGVGRIEQDDSLEPGRVIVIVGKDFVPPVSAATESAQ